MKQQKAADGNNRRALGDIGNLVHANARPVEGYNPKPNLFRFPSPSLTVSPSSVS